VIAGPTREAKRGERGRSGDPIHLQVGTTLEAAHSGWQAVVAGAIAAKSRTRTQLIAVSRFQQEGSGPVGRELRLMGT
jgi:hypothetical protein